MTEHRTVQPPLDPAAQQELLQAIGSLRFGTVEVTVHDGRIVQIERREKIRLSDAGKSRGKPQA